MDGAPGRLRQSELHTKKGRMPWIKGALLDKLREGQLPIKGSHGKIHDPSLQTWYIKNVDCFTCKNHADIPCIYHAYTVQWQSLLFIFPDVRRLQTMELRESDFTHGALHIRLRRRNTTWQLLEKYGDPGNDQVVAELNEEDIGPDGMRPWFIPTYGRLFYEHTMNRWVLMKTPDNAWKRGKR